ncbi:hypothetical protein GCM10022388_23080 [Flavobacterium chungnamense]|uniref:Uncharacterized protein n=1 Tax=Flavobacterium chungnamense TaxID=706182 RepID=A0ABP7UZ01_9FLAO
MAVSGDLFAMFAFRAAIIVKAARINPANEIDVEIILDIKPVKSNLGEGLRLKIAQYELISHKQTTIKISIT